MLSNPELVAPVQAANYYYSKTDYFDEIKTIYGQYTYDVLVGKFITLSNQFNDRFVLSEWHMYGSSRLGIQKPVSMDSHAELISASASTGRELVHIEFSGSWSSYEVNYADTSSSTITTYQMSYEYYSLTRGEKNYELTNHLGNVLVVISDKKLKTCTGDTVNYYTADVLQANDYYAFHANMSGRTYTASNSSYRFGGSNGQEKDDDIFAGAYSAEYWEYHADLGKRWNIDPIIKPCESSYAAYGNNPVWRIDPQGADSKPIMPDQSKNQDIDKAPKQDFGFKDDFYILKNGEIQVKRTKDNFDRFYLGESKEFIGQFNKNKHNLIALPESFSFSGKEGSFGFNYTGSSNENYISGDALAALFGALAQTGFTDVSLNHWSNSDGSSPSPSTSHLGGMVGDIRPLRKDKSGEPVLTTDEQFDIDRNAKLVAAIMKFGWTSILSERNSSTKYLTPGTSHYTGYWDKQGKWHPVRHNNHFHVQRFNPKIKVIQSNIP